MPTDPHLFGQILKATLRSARVCADELARRAQLSLSGVGHFLAGRRSPSFEGASAIADALGVPLDWFRRTDLPKYTGSVELWLAREEVLTALGHRASSAPPRPSPSSASSASSADPCLDSINRELAQLDVPQLAPASSPADAELAFAKQRLANHEPLTREEWRLFESYRKAQLRKGRTDGEAMHAAVDRLGDVWRGPAWRKRAATLAAEARSQGKPTRRPAKKRAPGRAANASAGDGQGGDGQAKTPGRKARKKVS